MPRVKRGNHRRLKRKRVLKQAKGYFQAKSKLYRYAKEAVDRAQKFAFIGRKLKKRDFRSLWIIRINAAARLHGLSYSRLMNGLKLAEIEVNRKMLSEMAIRDPEGFGQVAAAAKEALGAAGITVGADEKAAVKLVTAEPEAAEPATAEPEAVKPEAAPE